MSVINLILISIGLSVDSFAACITAGACMKRTLWKFVFKIGFFMAFFQALLPVIGWLIGQGFAKYIKAVDHWIAFVLLIIIGGKMIWDAFSNGDDEKACFCPNNHLMLAGMALATSIDAMIIGIGIGILETSIWVPVLFIGVSTFLFSVIGIKIGNYLGHKLPFNPLIAGGVILAGLGTKILIEHLIIQ